VEVYDHPEALDIDSTPMRTSQRRIAGCITDKTGTFKLSVSPGHYEVRFSKAADWDVMSVPVLVQKSARPSKKGIVVVLTLGT